MDGLGGAQRTVILEQTGPHDLVDVLAVHQVLEPMLAAIYQGKVGGQCVAHDVVGGRGEQQLPAVAGRLQPGDTVHRRPEVVSVALDGFTGVQRGTDGERGEVGAAAAPILDRDGPLDRDSGIQRVPGAGEDRAKGVAHRLEDDPAMGLDRRAQERVVPLERHPHRLGLPLPTLGAALDVGEEEGDGTGRWRRGRRGRDRSHGGRQPRANGHRHAGAGPRSARRPR